MLFTDRIKELEDNHRSQVYQLNIDWLKENTPFKVGDVVYSKDYGMFLLIRSYENHVRSSNDYFKEPCFSFYGRKLNYGNISKKTVDIVNSWNQKEFQLVYRIPSNAYVKRYLKNQLKYSSHANRYGLNSLDDLGTKYDEFRIFVDNKLEFVINKKSYERFLIERNQKLRNEKVTTTLVDNETQQTNVLAVKTDL